MDDRPERLARFGKSAFPRFEPVCRPLSCVVDTVRTQADADDRSEQPVESER